MFLSRSPLSLSLQTASLYISDFNRIPSADAKGTFYDPPSAHIRDFQPNEFAKLYLTRMYIAMRQTRTYGRHVFLLQAFSLSLLRSIKLSFLLKASLRKTLLRARLINRQPKEIKVPKRNWSILIFFYATNTRLINFFFEIPYNIFLLQYECKICCEKNHFLVTSTIRTPEQRNSKKVDLNCECERTRLSLRGSGHIFSELPAIRFP